MAKQEILTKFGVEVDGKRLTLLQTGVAKTTKKLKKATVQANKVTRRLNRVGVKPVKAMKRVATQAEIMGQKINGAVKRIGQMAAAYIGFRSVRFVTSDYAKAADAVAKFATATGLSTETYQGLIHAVELGGSDTANLNKALTQLAKRTLEAQQGLTTNVRAFREIGVEWTNSEGKLKSADELFLEMADSFKGMTSETRRTGLAMQLFGRTGATLLPTLLQGSDAIRAQIVEAKKLGRVLTPKQLKAAENYNDEMLRLKSIALGVRNIIGAALLPTITRLARSFRDWWVEGRNAERALRALKLTAYFASFALAALIGAKTITHMRAFASGLVVVIKGMRSLAYVSRLAALQTAMVGLAFVAIGLIIEDLVRFARGEDSVIGRLLGDSKLADELRSALLSVAAAAAQVWRELKPALLSVWRELKPALRDLGVALRPIAGPALKAAIEGLVFVLRALVVVIRIVTIAARSTAAVWTAVATIIGLVRGTFEDLSDSISDASDWVKALGVTFGRVIGVDFVVLANIVKTAWDVATGGIRRTLSTLINGAKTAMALLGALSGKKVGGLSSGAKAASKAGEQAYAVTNTGQPIMQGLKQPMPVTQFAHVAPAAATANVSPGAVQVTVHAGGDPKQIAAAVGAEVKRGIGAVFTSASRDLVAPPGGQS